MRLVSCLLLVAFAGNLATAEDQPFITSRSPVTLLSANDGAVVADMAPVAKWPRAEVIRDSVTVIQLGPNNPPQVRTVYGTVPNSISGPPYLAVQGRFGFITNHGSRMDTPLGEDSDFSKLPTDRKNLLTVIDLDTLEVVDQVELPSLTFMAAAHPDGKSIVVGTGREFCIYEMVDNKATLCTRSESPVLAVSFDISPLGNRIIAAGPRNRLTSDSSSAAPDMEVHVFSYEQQRIEHRGQVHMDPSLGKIDGPFAPRFSPDGRKVLVLNGFGGADKGRLDDVLSIDMTLEQPTVTELVEGVSDGLESVAFHPRGHLAVVACLVTDSAPNYSRLAVIDLQSKPMRLLYQLPIEGSPEGIEFSPDGDLLFVQCTYAHHIVVYDVDQYLLTRKPFVLHTGHSPSSMGISRGGR